MGITKTELFDEQTNNIASIFKVLGHPARITVIQILGISAKTNGDLVQALGLTQANRFRTFKNTNRSRIYLPHTVRIVNSVQLRSHQVAPDED